MPRPISYAVFCLKKKSNEEKARAKERIFSHLDFFFFFNDTATTEIYTLSLHDALPILRYARAAVCQGVYALHFVPVQLVPGIGEAAVRHFRRFFTCAAGHQTQCTLLQRGYLQHDADLRVPQALHQLAGVFPAAFVHYIS
mgnify:CR=1 FL=1